MSAARMAKYGMIGALIVAVAAWRFLAAPPMEAGAQVGAESEFPAFLIRPSGESGRPYTAGLRLGPDAIRIDDAFVDAVVRRIENNLFELTLTPKKELSEVWFPWPAKEFAASNTSADDYVYYPYIMGTRRPARDLVDWGWKGVDYPGPLFAPLMALGDDREAMYVAAANWPPRPVAVLYCKQRLTLRYRGHFRAGESVKFRAIIGTARGNAASGDDPWRAGVKEYRAWLDTHLKAENLWPIEAPAHVRNAHGWLNVQLENFRQFDAREILRRWDVVRSFMPWLQFWGQMSNYSGPAESAIPPRLTDEEVGCCLDKIAFHHRYLPDLPEVARRITVSGGHVGYYSRPAQDARLDVELQESTHNAWSRLLNWTASNTRHGANAYYVDVLAASTFGDPLTIARRIRDELPKGVVLEYAKDIYPAAFLISGCLMHKGQDGAESDAFPRFGRSLLADRHVFLGQSNGDYHGWGQANEYATERQVFLLGAKFDVMNPWASGYSGRLNPILERIIHLRDSVHWWARSPVYLDREGIGDVPIGIDVRRFRASDGATLLVFDNPRRFSGRTIQLDGRTLAVPIEPLAIVEPRPEQP